MDVFFADFADRMAAVTRDFEQVIAGLPQAALDWVPGPDMSSISMLVVHTTRATRFLIGDVALQEFSNGEREKDFMVQQLPVAELQARLRNTQDYVTAAMARLTLADLATEKQFPNRDVKRPVSWLLLHALDHAYQHLGHAQVTRQMWEQQNP